MADSRLCLLYFPFSLLTAQTLDSSTLLSSDLALEETRITRFGLDPPSPLPFFSIFLSSSVILADHPLIPFFISHSSHPFHQYLLKQYLQTDGTEPIYRTMYDDAMQGIKSKLIYESNDLMYTAELAVDRQNVFVSLSSLLIRRRSSRFIITHVSD